MKTKKTMMGLALAVVICSTNAFANNLVVNTNNAKVIMEGETPVFADSKMNNVYQHYIHLKTALVNNNLEEAEKGTEMLDKAIKEAGLISRSILPMVEAKDVKEKRGALDTLSLELADVFKKAKIVSGVVYKQYCPMANGGKGGYWLASEAKIQNPYYGKMMMSCGSVKEEIKEIK
jgi:hypothetical protein